VLPILSLTKPNSQDLGSILKGGESRVALKLGSVSVGCREDEGWLGRMQTELVSQVSRWALLTGPKLEGRKGLW
jgi:hypothetical protein